MPTISGTVLGQLVLTVQTVTPSDGSIVDSMVNASAGVKATKLQQQVPRYYSQQSGSAATSITFPIHTVYGPTVTVVAIYAGSVSACAGAATITVDLKKNGTTVLSSVITLDNANVARVPEYGTITTSGGVVGDMYELVVTATVGGGTLGNGFFAGVIFREDPGT